MIELITIIMITSVIIMICLMNVNITIDNNIGKSDMTMMILRIMKMIGKSKMKTVVMMIIKKWYELWYS